MSAGFGFSVGDIVAGLKLIKQSIEAFQDTKGSSATYQALIHEIDSLKDGLEAIEDLSLDQRFGPKSKQCLAVQEAIARCWHCIDNFLSTTAKFQPWLGSDAPPGFRRKASLRKVQWALCKRDDVSRFRAQLERHCSSISMLLVTLQVSQSFSQSAKYQEQCQVVLDSHSEALDLQKKYHQTTALLAGLSLEQRQLFQSLIESNRRLVDSNERMAYELQQMRGAMQLQLELPPQVVLQRPVTLLDACGQVSAFHLDFINSSDAFLAVLKIRFRQYGVEQRGLRMLDDSQFVLEDRRGKLDLSRPWSQILRPSQKVEMSMVFHRDIHPSICPVCRSLNETDLASAIECHVCGLYYQRVQELITGAVESPNVARATSLYQNDLSYSDGPKQLSTPEHSDVIDQFRRVQLVSKDHQAETNMGMELSGGTTDQQFVLESTEHTDIVQTNLNAYTAPLHKRKSYLTSGEGTTTDEPLTRPRLSYSDLIRQALSSSQSHPLSLSQIYHAIESTHPFYKSQAQTFGWQTSVRRTLKQDPSFCRIELFGASPVWKLKQEEFTANGKQRRHPPMPVQTSAASASPLHLFDMSAALLSRVEQRQIH
ncbi:MAG: hypothetical protein Q9226_001692 [Calogaya cf. arnoldii]